MTVERITERGWVTGGLEVEIAITLVVGAVIAIEAEWTPNPPARLSGSARRRYRRIRARLLARAAARLGGPVLVAEV